MPSPSHTQPIPPREQREKLLDNEREANRDAPRNFKDDALTDKKVEVQPDGTGPTPTRTFDAPEDRARESGKSKTRKPVTRRR